MSLRSRSLMALSVVLLLLPVTIATAKTHSDPVGDVVGPLDIDKVTLDWNSKTIKGRISVVEDFDPSLLEFENHGSLWFTMLTDVTDTNYAWRYHVYIAAYEGGDLYGSLAGGSEYGDTEWIDYIDVAMTNDNTVRFDIPRSLITGDTKKSKFHYWYQASYTNEQVCDPVCDDFAPDGDEIYKGKF